MLFGFKTNSGEAAVTGSRQGPPTSLRGVCIMRPPHFFFISAPPSLARHQPTPPRVMDMRHDRFVLSAEETTAVQTFLTKPKKPQDAKMVMGGMAGSFSNSDRRAAGSGSSKKKGPLGETVGDRLEVSGESILLVKEVAERIAQDRCGVYIRRCAFPTFVVH